MPGTRAYKITPQFIAQVVKFIRAGGFLTAAAEAAGIPAAVCHEWLRRGDRHGCNPLYRQLLDQVRTAAAEARLTAEITVFNKHQKDWLLHGPGKDSPTTPGWSQAPRPSAHGDGSADGNTMSALLGVLGGMVRELKTYPELQRQLIAILDKSGIPIAVLRQSLRIFTEEEELDEEEPRPECD